MESIEKEIRETFEYFGKNTQRKRHIFLKKEMLELETQIQTLEKLINKQQYKDVFGTYGLFEGVKIRQNKLNSLKARLNYYTINFKTLTK